MAEQSHRAEMSAAIRAQRERAGYRRGQDAASAPQVEPASGGAAAPPRRTLLARLLGRGK